MLHAHLLAWRSDQRRPPPCSHNRCNNGSRESELCREIKVVVDSFGQWEGRRLGQGERKKGRERERERHKERKRKGGEQVVVHEHSFIAQDKRTSKVSASDWRRQASNLRVGQMQARIQVCRLEENLDSGDQEETFIVCQKVWERYRIKHSRLGAQLRYLCRHVARRHDTSERGAIIPQTNHLRRVRL